MDAVGALPGSDIADGLLIMDFEGVVASAGLEGVELVAAGIGDGLGICDCREGDAGVVCFSCEVDSMACDAGATRMLRRRNPKVDGVGGVPMLARLASRSSSFCNFRSTCLSGEGDDELFLPFPFFFLPLEFLVSLGVAWEMMGAPALDK